MQEKSDWLVDLFRGQAQLGFEEGDYTRTHNSCDQVLAHVPTDAEAWHLLGEAALASRDYATAVRCYEQLLELNPQEPVYAVQLGKVFVQLKAWDAAAAALRQALQAAPGDEQATHFLTLVERMRAIRDLLDQSAPPTPGRNDPCNCGSGLKYKKCCLLKSTDDTWRQLLAEAEQAEDWMRVLAAVGQQRTVTAESRRAEAVAQFHLGRRQLARPLIEASLESFGTDAELLAMYGDLLLDDNNLTKSETLARQALALEPRQWRARLLLAVCQIRRNDHAQAESTLRELVEVVPDCRPGWERLSDLLWTQGRGEEAVQELESWTRREPGNPDAWFRLGFVKVRQERSPQEAGVAFEQALALKPDHHEALCWLGHCRRFGGDLQGGQQLILQGLQLKSDYAMGWDLLGQLYYQHGQQYEANSCFRRMLAVNPYRSEAWDNLGNVFMSLAQLDVAERYERQALRLNGRNVSAWNNLGGILNAARRISEAMDCFQTAIGLDPRAVDPKVNYGTVLSSFARFDEAIEVLEPLCVRNQTARSNILFVVNCHPDWSGERIYRFYREQIAPHFPARQYFDYANERSPARRLRVGYISPDFRDHVVSHFFRPLLDSHDASQVELFAYSEVRREDGITAQIKGRFDHWRSTVGLSDEQLAEQIRADGIDILVDLAGHTEHNRMATFALKPAPVQVMYWIGIGYTSGLDSMDYFLADEELVPTGSEAVFAETPWRLPCPSIAYQARPDMPEINVLPARRNGYITFGSLTRSIRLNHKVVRAWAELLTRVPGSHLVLNSAQFDDAGVCEHFAAEFARHGIARERLEMGYTSPPWSVMAQIDIALDCFPHNSGTTLFESLWMGLPYVTLRDRPSMGRIGSEILRGLGREEWIADSEEEYVDKLVALAGDIEALERIRHGLREEMRQSDLCNGPLLAGRVEAAYRAMWQRYCEQGTAA
ncbi:Beta-barrel assembly-enhancing protease [compost metagenome]